MNKKEITYFDVTDAILFFRIFIIGVALLKTVLLYPARELQWVILGQGSL